MLYSIFSIFFLTTSILAIPKPKPYSSSNRLNNPFVYHDNDINTSPSFQSSAVKASASSSKANTFSIVGETGASAQQLFVGTANRVYIVDKTENNTAQINGHSAWATHYDLSSNSYTSLDILTNSFCAGGNQLGNGSWVNIGGNQAVVGGGVAAKDANTQEGAGIYQDRSGGRDVRVITPCDDNTCNWTDDIDGMPGNRWYPTIETLQDGSVIIIGGNLNGSFVNNVGSNVNTYEYWPTRGAPVNSPFLANTAPANLYPLTWILPDGRLFMQASWSTTLLDLTTGGETPLPNITKAQKTYPASGATAVLPLLVKDNYKMRLLFCGGMNPVRDDWNPDLWNIANTNTSSSCVSINPTEPSPRWADDDDLPENRGMGNFIILPDFRLFLVNGVAQGSAGYGNQSWVLGHSYAQNPVFRPAYYDPSAPTGSRWNYLNLPLSTIGRLYHSTATLLPDGSVFIAGSNPNADVVTEQNYPSFPYKTEYRAEIFYPDYFDSPRPNVTGIPTSITYGGASFDLNLTIPVTSGGNATDLNSIKIGLMRTGFSTHSMNMGMKYIQLNNTYTSTTSSSSNSVVLHVSPLPPNPALFVPGPALLFVVVNGVPSIGQFVMVGNGQIGQQPTQPLVQLKASTGTNLLGTGTNSTSSASGTGSSSTTSSSGSNSNANSSSKKSGGSKSNAGSLIILGLGGMILLSI